MEPTEVRVTIRKHKDSAESAELVCFLDTGMAYALIPGKTLRDLGIEPDDEETFFVGMDTVVRKKGDAHFQLGDRGGYGKVLFGEEGDVNLMGFRNLEALGLMLHPFSLELLPLRPMMVIR